MHNTADLSLYCSREIVCSCGHTHECPISDVVIEKGAVEKVPALLSGYARVFLTADQNTWPLCGERLRALLGGKYAGHLVFQREGVLVPDEHATEELKAVLPADTDFILGIGSGVINDICKYVSFEKDLPYGICATAPSMDGYASSGAAMITGGMKVTYTTRPPKYIIGDVNIVKNAPIGMIRSGYGDIIGKYSAVNDWKLSHLVNGEHFCPWLASLVISFTDEVRDAASAIAARGDEAIASLLRALVLSGITLSLNGTTRPGSGSEHHLSHFFEITGLVHHQPYLIHGTDVAYSTIVTARMREKIRALESPVFCAEDETARKAAWARVFGPLAGEVASLQEKAGSYQKDRSAVYRGKWQEIRAILSECPSAGECRDMMLAVGFDPEEFISTYGEAKIRDAMLYGKDLKDRYTVLWLYYSLFSGRKTEENDV